MKTKYPIIALVLVLITGIYAWSVYKEKGDINSFSSGMTFKKIVKTGTPHIKWFRSEKGFHYLMSFDEDNFIAHSNSIFFGALDLGDWIKLECKPINDNKCADAVLLEYKAFKKGTTHTH